MLSREKIKGALLGVAIGDALGGPVEMMSVEAIAKKHGRVEQYLPYTRRLFKGSPPGTTTDDWALTSVVAKAIVEAGRFDMDVLSRMHVESLAQTGPRGWGKTTTEAVKRLSEGVHWSQSGGFPGGGNGIAMKIAPLAIYCLASGEDIRNYLVPFSIMTHGVRIAMVAGAAQAAALQYVLGLDQAWEFDRGDFKTAVMTMTTWAEEQTQVPEEGTGVYEPPEMLVYDSERHGFQIEPDYHQLSNPLSFLDEAHHYSPERIIEAFKGGCYSYESIPFSLIWFARNPTQIETLYDVASAGGDTDTNASMVGSLLGALHGVDLFPDHLRNGLDGSIMQVIDEFADRIGEQHE